MYFPLGWPKRLNGAENPICSANHIVSSVDRMLFAVIGERSITIWYSKPCVQIVTLVLCKERASEVGPLSKAEWKPDSSLMAVMTEESCVVFIKIEVDNRVPNHHCLYVMQEGKVPVAPKVNINGILDSDSIPAIKLSYVTHIRLQAKISCFLSVRDELVVGTVDGCLNRLRWSGNKNEKATLYLKDIPVSTDLQQFRGTRMATADCHVVELEYSPTLGGYSMVLSSGKALFVIPPSSRGEKTTAHGVWAQEINNTACVAVNHRYRLIAFGLHSGEGLVYHLDEGVGALEVSHKLVISSKEFPDAGLVAGSVTGLKWTPDGTALAMSWKNGGLSLWSVFGSLLLCTLGGDYSCSENSSTLYPPPIVSMEWGLEGYHLWLVTKPRKSKADDASSPSQLEESFAGECDRRYHSNGREQESNHLIQFQFLKSALTVNPCMSNHEHVFLQGEDKLYMSTGDTMARASANAHHKRSHSNSSSNGPSHGYIGNKQWQVIPISHSYLASNWPIRYAAVDRAGQCVAVAGKTGFAHYALFSRKWKLFGNETQERDMVVSGGITWWKDFVCLACFNIQGQRDEIRCYPRSCKLDNTFSQVCRVESQVLLLNTFRDMLIVFCADSHVAMFSLERKNVQPNPSVFISKVQEISLSSFIPHPLCVAGITLTSLTSESVGIKLQPSVKEAESMLLNVSGKLLMFQRDHSGPQIKEETGKHRAVPFCNPSVVATSVENLWTTTRANVGKVQLMEAMWLGCGSHGMKVWLPLRPRDEGKAHNFMSRRIMLPFRVDIYPLAVLFEDAVILGAACDVVSYSVSSSLSSGNGMPFCTLERTSQIYLHHVLRQLLRRNLGVNALDLARSCTELAYFPHVLELLLHEVLEAEATSKEPIPDPLLPRVVAFIQEFPEFLQTIVHCARKTEVALWPYLFSTVGNPKDLFEECLLHRDLDTAATYLIILQNLEKPIVSRQHATILLDSALDQGSWELCRDLVRFLKAIDSNENPDSPGSAAAANPMARLSGSTTFPAYAGTPPLSSDSHNAYNYSNVSNVGRLRTSSIAEPREISWSPKEKAKVTVSDSLINAGKRLVDWPNAKNKQSEPTAEQVYIDMILCRHARKLLATNQLRTLGYFAANMEDFHFVSWLKRERVRAGKVEDFVSALREIHSQFEWPMPVLSAHALHHLRKSQASSSLSLASSILDDDLLGPNGDHPSPLTHSQPTLTPTVAPGAPTGSRTTSTQPSECGASHTTTDDIFLKPQTEKVIEENSIATIEVSDSSSLLGDYEVVSDPDNISLDIDGICQEVASHRGPAQSHLELEYLLHIMLEAGCLEWAVILATALRDQLAIIRVVNTASLTDTPLDMVARMREGLSFLQLWSETECLGYKPFLHKIHGEIKMLSKVVETSPDPSLSLDVSGSSSSETPSVEEGNVSPGVQSIRSDGETVSDEPDQATQSKDNCVVS